MNFNPVGKSHEEIIKSLELSPEQIEHLDKGLELLNKSTQDKTDWRNLIGAIECFMSPTEEEKFFADNYGTWTNK